MFTFFLSDLCEEAATPGGLNEQVGTVFVESSINYLSICAQSLKALRASEHFKLAEEVILIEVMARLIA